jgi:hypothetical protein
MMAINYWWTKKALDQVVEACIEEDASCTIPINKQDYCGCGMLFEKKGMLTYCPFLDPHKFITLEIQSKDISVLRYYKCMYKALTRDTDDVLTGNKLSGEDGKTN